MHWEKLSCWVVYGLVPSVVTVSKEVAKSIMGHNFACVERQDRNNQLVAVNK